MNSLELAALNSELVKISESFVVMPNLGKIELTVESLSNINITVKRKGGYVNEKVSSPITILLSHYYVGKKGNAILVFNPLTHSNGDLVEVKLEDIYRKINLHDADVLLDRLYDLIFVDTNGKCS